MKEEPLMKSKIRILHLEDDRKDSELIQSTIMKAGIDCNIVRIETRDDFINNLEDCGFDIILADYTIPSFDGLTALRITQEKCPFIPFVFVSGTMGEEKAIETLKSGATDYVLKNNLSRLVPAVNRALREAQERQERRLAQKELLQEKTRVQKYLAIAGVILIAIDADEKVTLINKKGCQILGYEEKEIVGKNWFDNFVPDKIRKEIRDVFGKLIAGEIEAVEYFENPVLNKDGREMIIAWHNASLYDGEGNIIGTLSSGEDVTERKKAEEKINHLLDIITRAKEEWELTFDNVTEIILLIGRDLRILRCNKSFSEFAGISINEIIGTKCYDFIPCDQTQIGYCRVSLQTGEPLRKTEFQTKTGHWFYESHCPIIDENGKFYFSVIVATDITDLKNTHQSLIEYQEDLKDRVRELEDFYEMGVGRELKMIELKEELEKLKEELEKYKKDE